MQTGNATFSLTEAGYRGSYTVVSSAPAAVSAVSPVAATSDTTTVTADALAAGSANLTVTDRNGQSVVVAVGVTLTPVAIQGVRR
jgi:hypothetical protein